jgi:hypothetical protein
LRVTGFEMRPSDIAASRFAISPTIAMTGDCWTVASRVAPHGPLRFVSADQPAPFPRNPFFTEWVAGLGDHLV